jgi:NADPH:quinone reductase-like Zn-dependent oxidoreductase
VHATALRSRPLEEKAAICQAVVDGLWPLVASGAVRPVVDAVLPLPEAGAAHARVEASEHVGKVLLAVPA